MAETPKFTGDGTRFHENWSQRAEAAYNHWTSGDPQNQIQLAFRSHWDLFKEIMGDRICKGRSLEVGCGRASISSYFAANGFEITGIDISAAAISMAEKIFNINKHQGRFIQGDACALPFSDNMFEVCVSIGLLEHFENVETVIAEQVRVLNKGGLFLGYVVPENKNNIQKDYNWINDILKLYAKREISEAPKSDIFRSDFSSEYYIPIMKKSGLKDICSSGVYPLPMVSPSIDFPFTLMPPPMEKVLVDHFIQILKKRKASEGRNPWLCEESYGQAFLVWGWKA